MTANYIINLPALGGARESGAKLAESLPDELTGAQVVVDAENNVTCSQGFTDELFKQILEVRNADSVIVENWSEKIKVYATLSGVKRSYLTRILFR